MAHVGAAYQASFKACHAVPRHLPCRVMRKQVKPVLQSEVADGSKCPIYLLTGDCQFGRIKAVFGVIIVAVFQCMGTVSQGAKPRSPSHLILLVLV